jgi:hypothetical protein
MADKLPSGENKALETGAAVAGSALGRAIAAQWPEAAEFEFLVASVFGSAFRGTIGKYEKKRREWALDEISRGKRKLTLKMIQSDAVAHCAMLTSEAILRASDERKTRALVRLLLGEVDDSMDENRTQEFERELNVIRTLSTDDWKILMEIEQSAEIRQENNGKTYYRLRLSDTCSVGGISGFELFERISLIAVTGVVYRVTPTLEDSDIGYSSWVFTELYERTKKYALSTWAEASES